MAKKLKEGDKIVFHNSKSNHNDPDVIDLTFGKIYEVHEAVNGEVYVLDDVGDINYACDPTGSGKWTKIVD